MVGRLEREADPWGVRAAAATWEMHTPLDTGGIGIDSIGLLGLADEVARRFDLFAHGLEEYLLARRTLGAWSELVLEGWRRSPDPRIVFRSSGSTGTPTETPHRLDDLVSECEAFLTILPRAHRVFALVPLHHIYGFLFGWLMPLLAGIPVVETAGDPFAVRPVPGDRIVAVPSLWRHLSGSDPKRLSWREVHGISSTAPLPEGEARRLRGEGLHVFEVFGSTETAGIGWRDRTAGPYRLLPTWRRAEADPAVLIRPGDAGRMVALVDRVAWVGEDAFRPRGRIDDVVQVSGHNVSTGAVARRIEELPEVAEAAVRLMRPDDGERLKAVVVPADPADAAAATDNPFRRRLEAWAARELLPHERPVFTIAARIPRDGMGKLADWPAGGFPTGRE